MKISLLTPILLGLAAATSTLSQTSDDRMLGAIHRVFGPTARSSTVDIRLTPEELARVRSIAGAAGSTTLHCHVVTIEGKRVGYGIVDNVRGKSQLITYGVMVDPSLVLKDLEVLVYREPYGGEIAYDAFRRQFRGKSIRDNVRVGGSIRNISGATISSNAVTNGTRILLGALQVLRDGGRLP